jgi:hypothetical protein
MIYNHSLFPPDSQQPFSGFKAQSVENAPFGATLSAVETLQKRAEATEISSPMPGTSRN